jgi:hypothetical protein
MKNWIYLLIISCFFISACNDEAKSPTDALNTGRNFIRASLDGNFKEAEKYLLQENQSLSQYKHYQIFYQDMPDSVKENYKKASFEIHQIDEPNDSITTISYSNSYMNENMSIKLVRRDGKWWIDFSEINPTK